MGTCSNIMYCTYIDFKLYATRYYRGYSLKFKKRRAISMSIRHDQYSVTILAPVGFKDHLSWWYVSNK